MAEIPVTWKGKTLHALVDDADVDKLTDGGTWHLTTRGYPMRNRYFPRAGSKQRKESDLMHRVVMDCTKGDGTIVDHINRNKLDNRRSNLRLVTSHQSNQNLPGGHGKSGVRGVHWRADRNRWWVRMTLNGKWHCGGTFTDLAEAEKAARELRAKLMSHAVD